MLGDYFSPKIKLLGKTALAGGMVGSGSGIASLLREEAINYTTVDETLEPNEKMTAESGELKYTSITEYPSLSLVMEYSVIMKTIKVGEKEKTVDVSYLDDLIHEEKADCIYYIKKADGKKVRISPKKPTKDPKKAYKGRKLNEFSWRKDGKSSTKPWYGYCSPRESDLRGEECQNLPPEWTAKEI